MFTFQRDGSGVVKLIRGLFSFYKVLKYCLHIKETEKRFTSRSFLKEVLQEKEERKKVSFFSARGYSIFVFENLYL